MSIIYNNLKGLIGYVYIILDDDAVYPEGREGSIIILSGGKSPALKQ